MRGAFVALVATAIIAAAILGLVENHGRSGPFDERLSLVENSAIVSGTYHARPAGETIPGICLAPPCEARTEIDVRLKGLPRVPYEARLSGATTKHLGSLAEDATGHILRWSEAADHTDKDRLVLVMAGKEVMSVPVRATPEPLRLDGAVIAKWPALTGEAHLAEIGGLAVSTIAAVGVDAVPPAGWAFDAYLEGTDGTTYLGTLDAVVERSELDGRIERMRLEDQHGLFVVLRPDHATPANGGFPILHAAVGAEDPTQSSSRSAHP